MSGIFLKQKFFSRIIHFTPPTIGAIGIFTSAGAAPTTKYIFGTDAVVPGAAIVAGAANGCCMGNSVQGIFQTISGPAAKYVYSNDTVVSGATLAPGGTRTTSGAIGNATLGLISSSALLSIAHCSTYSYSSDTVADTGVTMAGNINTVQAIGDSVHGIFVSLTGTTSSYIYASNVTAGATSLTSNTGTASNTIATLGIINRGSTGTDKYVFSGNVVTVATSLVTSIPPAATGNDTVGIFGGTTGTSVTKYKYSNDSVTAGPVISANTGETATSNGITGVNV